MKDINHKPVLNSRYELVNAVTWIYLIQLHTHDLTSVKPFRQWSDFWIIITYRCSNLGIIVLAIKSSGNHFLGNIYQPNMHGLSIDRLWMVDKISRGRGRDAVICIRIGDLIQYDDVILPV